MTILYQQKSNVNYNIYNYMYIVLQDRTVFVQWPENLPRPWEKMCQNRRKGKFFHHRILYRLKAQNVDTLGFVVKNQLIMKLNNQRVGTVYDICVENPQYCKSTVRMPPSSLTFNVDGVFLVIRICT